MSLSAPGTARNRGPAPRRHAEALILPESYSAAPLKEDIEKLCDPGVELKPELLVGAALKYFFTYVYPGAHSDRVPLSEITALFELFSRHRSLNEPDDHIDTMNFLRRYSYALRMLGDTPKTAHILRSIATARLSEAVLGEPFLGLDMGTGTGVLMLGEYILARRNGFADPEIWGIEYDENVAARTDALVKDLGIGAVALADARHTGTYRLVGDRAVTFVANETVASPRKSMHREDFFAIHEALFTSLKGGLANASFFPEGLIVYDPDQNVSVVLSKSNAFLGPKEYRSKTLHPQALVIEGDIVPLHKLGAEFLPLFTQEGRAMLQRRW